MVGVKGREGNKVGRFNPHIHGRRRRSQNPQPEPCVSDDVVGALTSLVQGFRELDRQWPQSSCSSAIPRGLV